MKKLFVAFMLMSSLSYAGALTTPISVPSTGAQEFVLAPIGALEFNPSTPNNYGLAVAESVCLANLMPADSSHVFVSPVLFVGVFAAANIGKWVATNGGASWSIDYGIMVGLPKLDDTLPEVAFSASWNTQERGDAKIMINAAVPVDILPDVLVHKL